MLVLQGHRDVMGSKGRADRVVEMIGAQEDVESILRDHVAPLCEHRPHNSTLWSVVADLDAHHIAYAPGTPCRVPFQPVAWPAR